MRQLVVENQEILLVPQNINFFNVGKVKSVTAGDFTLLLDYAPDGILKNAIYEFYTQTPSGRLYFDSYVKSIDGNLLTIASPTKHRFLQRRQYTRIKYLVSLDMKDEETSIPISTLDISAGGMKFKTDVKIDIAKDYYLELSLTDKNIINLTFQPIRIEKYNEGGYLVSGQFVFKSNHDKMLLIQYCTKRSVEIKNK